jgi:L-lactate dehydrogenase (cytochrome)/(S)-mandelate dehydrogenase
MAVSLERAITIDDLRRMARKRLPKIIFDFIEGGVEDEEGLRYNEAALRRYRLVPRYMVDVEKRDLSVTLLGKTYAMPFGIAPTGLNGLFRRDTDLVLARLAADLNIPYAMSSVSNNSLEQAARIAPHMWLQVYGANDRTIVEDMARRARDAGISTLIITADVPVSPKRVRNIRNGFSRTLRMTLPIILQGMSRPAWSYEFLRHGGIPALANWIPYAPPGAGVHAVTDRFATQTPSPNQTWRDVERMRRLWPGNLMIKGILHPDDAKQAVSLGANGIIVSNHGGRQLDRAVSPVDMLPAIRAGLGPDVCLLLDSGVRQGSDVVVARCLGADAVLTGRATLYGAVAAALPGARRAADILRDELDLTLGQIGCPAFAQWARPFLFDPAAPAAWNAQATGAPAVALAPPLSSVA